MPSITTLQLHNEELTGVIGWLFYIDSRVPNHFGKNCKFLSEKDKESLESFADEVYRKLKQQLSSLDAKVQKEVSKPKTAQQQTQASQKNNTDIINEIKKLTLTAAGPTEPNQSTDKSKTLSFYSNNLHLAGLSSLLHSSSRHENRLRSYYNSCPNGEKNPYIEAILSVRQEIKSIPWWKCLTNFGSKQNIYFKNYLNTVAKKLKSNETITAEDRYKWQVIYNDVRYRETLKHLRNAGKNKLETINKKMQIQVTPTSIPTVSNNTAATTASTQVPSKMVSAPTEPRQTIQATSKPAVSDTATIPSPVSSSTTDKRLTAATAITLTPTTKPQLRPQTLSRIFPIIVTLSKLVLQPRTKKPLSQKALSLKVPSLGIVTNVLLKTTNKLLQKRGATLVDKLPMLMPIPNATRATDVALSTPVSVPPPSAAASASAMVPYRGPQTQLFTGNCSTYNTILLCFDDLGNTDPWLKSAITETNVPSKQVVQYTSNPREMESHEQRSDHSYDELTLNTSYFPTNFFNGLLKVIETPTLGSNPFQKILKQFQGVLKYLADNSSVIFAGLNRVVGVDKKTELENKQTFQVDKYLDSFCTNLQKELYKQCAKSLLFQKQALEILEILVSMTLTLLRLQFGCVNEKSASTTLDDAFHKLLPKITSIKEKNLPEILPMASIELIQLSVQKRFEQFMGDTKKANQSPTETSFKESQLHAEERFGNIGLSEILRLGYKIVLDLSINLVNNCADELRCKESLGNMRTVLSWLKIVLSEPVSDTDEIDISGEELNLADISGEISPEKSSDEINLDDISDTISPEKSSDEINLDDISDTIGPERASDEINLDDISDTIRPDQSFDELNLEDASDIIPIGNPQHMFTTRGFLGSPQKDTSKHTPATINFA